MKYRNDWSHLRSYSAFVMSMAQKYYILKAYTGSEISCHRNQTHDFLCKSLNDAH